MAGQPRVKSPPGWRCTWPSSSSAKSAAAIRSGGTPRSRISRSSGSGLGPRHSKMRVVSPSGGVGGGSVHLGRRRLAWRAVLPLPFDPAVVTVLQAHHQPHGSGSRHRAATCCTLRRGHQMDGPAPPSHRGLDPRHHAQSISCPSGQRPQSQSRLATGPIRYDCGWESGGPVAQGRGAVLTGTDLGARSYRPASHFQRGKSHQFLRPALQWCHL